MKDLYFSHDRNALNDNKIFDMRGIYHMEGYGVYWGIIEALSREPDLSLEYSEKKAMALAEGMHPSFDMLTYIKDCIDIGLFRTDGTRFWSESLRRRMATASEKAALSEKRRAAANARWAKNGNPPPPNPPPTEENPLADKDWKSVVSAYEMQIGMLPTGYALDNLLSYYDDMGAGAMLVAIRRTNEEQPEVPYKYLKAILEAFIQNGVDSAEKAEAFCVEFDRKRKRRQPQGASQQAPAPVDDPENDVRWGDD